MKNNIKKLQDYLKNKQICLLGNARSILNSNKAIDNYEIVCRMNHGLPIGKEQYIGSRTDILFTSTPLSKSEINRFDAEYIIWITKNEKIPVKEWQKLAIQNPPIDWLELKRHYPKDKIPSTGCVAINFLLKRIQFKSLTIYGYDFFHTGTHYHNLLNQSWHPKEIEEKLIKRMINNRSNVEIIYDKK